MHKIATSAIALCFVLASCAQDEKAETPSEQAGEQTSEPTTETPSEVQSDPKPSMTDVAALNIPNLSQPSDEMLCAGQLSQAQMDALHAAGFKSFISLRVAGERGAGWEEAHASASEIDFQRLEIHGADDIDSAHAKELHELLAETEKPVVLYCGSSNRVGALLAIAAKEIEGKSAEEALQYGFDTGVTGLEPIVREKLGLQ